MISTKDRSAIRRLLAERANPYRDDGREVADTQTVIGLDAAISKAILAAVPGARPTNGTGAKHLAGLAQALVRVQQRDRSVAGDFARPYDASIRRAATEAGVPVEQALALPEALKRRLCEIAV